MDVLLADVDLAAKAGKYLMYVLAVAGGFLIGNWLTWLVCRLVAKLLLKRAINFQLERALRILGGIAGAALVAFLLFRFGTGWGFGGSGTGEGEGTGAPTKGGDQPDTAKDKQPPNKVEPKPKEDPATPTSAIKVTVLRGAAFPKTFLFDGETEALDLAAAKEKLRKLNEEAGGRLKFVDLIIYKNSTAEGHPLIKDFESFAYDLGLRTSRQKKDQSLPE